MNMIRGNKEDKDVLMAVVGNKSNLEDSREVATFEGKDFALSCGALFAETSAKTRETVEEVIFDLIREARIRRKSGGESSCRAF